MKFDYIIGNPPYQEEASGTSNRDEPLYHHFYEEAMSLAKKVLLITPGRFLFNAGQTPKSWNKMMLNNEHFKVIEYNPSSVYFKGVDIKGGVAIGYYDRNKKFEPIEIFTPFPLLNSIVKKVKNESNIINDIVVSTAYKFTDLMHQENPQAKDKINKSNDLRTNIFKRIPEIFYDEEPDNLNNYMKVYGRENNNRKAKLIKQNYIEPTYVLNSYKVLVPKVNGTGTFGETLSNPFVAKPGEIHTQSFISIGNFTNEDEAYNLVNYLKTKFVRAMLGVLKVTPDNPPAKWKYVPLQDFTSDSDIDWTKPIPEIDQQLYKKYDLTDEEIEFIETNVKEME